MISYIKKELKKYADPEKAAFHQKFFKTHKGGYGEGDKFIGVTVPVMRKIAKAFKLEKIEDIQKLLKSKIHEERFVALLQLVQLFEKAVKEKNGKVQKQIYDFYLAHAEKINNWDLVDVSAHKIVGRYLFKKAESTQLSVLKKLAKSDLLWERRIAMIATWWFIRHSHVGPVFVLAEKLLKDDHDLMHKAVGWMLREAGKKDMNQLESFLQKNYKQMPRTMLRYAIERIEEKRRKKYIKGEI